MANLLSWLGNKVKQDVINPIQRDIVQPVARNVQGNINNANQAIHQAPQVINRDVVAPVQRAVQNPIINTALHTAVGPFAGPPHIPQSAPSFVKPITQIPGQLAHGLVQGAARTGLSAGISLIDNPQTNNIQVRPTNAASKWLLGNDTVGNVIQEAKKNQINSVLGNKVPKPLAALSGVGLLAGNLAYGGGGAEEKLAQGTVDAISKANNAKTILGIVAKDKKLANLQGDIGKTFASRVANVTDAKTIRQEAAQAVQASKDRIAQAGIKVTAKPNQDLVKAGKLSPDVNTVPAKSLQIGSDAKGAYDGKVVSKYINDIKAGKPVEPVVASNEGGKLFVQDGKHRLLAAKKLGIDNIPAQIQAPKTAPEVAKVFDNAALAKKTGVLASIKGKFNPVAEYGKAGEQSASALQSKLGELSADIRPVTADSAARAKIFDNMTPAEHLDFINKIQHGEKQATPELQAVADQYAHFNAQGAEVAKTIKPDFQALDNYFTQSGLVSKEDASALAQKWLDKSNTPGSLQHRTFPSVQEAVQFANENKVPLKETNPEKLFLRNHQQVLTSGKLNEFKAAQDAAGVDPAITQKLIDRVSERGLSGSPSYERYRQVAGTVNNVQLAGGFHYGKTAFEKLANDAATAINETVSGHPITAVKGAVKNAGSDLAGFGYIKGRNFAKDVADGVSNKYTEAAKLANYNPAPDARYVVNGLRKSFDEVTSGSFGKAAKGIALSPLRLINSAMSPLMKHFVPNVKNAAFMSQVDAADAILGKGASAADKALAYQKAGNTVDGIFGQMNQDNLFWSKTVKDALSVAMRSPGYNIGTLQQVGGGVKDLFQPHIIKALRGEGSALPDSINSLVHGKGLSTRSAYTAALTTNTMIMGAITTYLFTGKGPGQILDYFYPPTGATDKNGNAERISLPSYSKDVFSFIHNPVATVGNKLSPLFSEGKQLATNRNYYGDLIRNPNDSLGTQAGQVGSYLKSTNLPFSLQSANKRVDKGIGAKAESALGLNVAPGYITQSPFQQKVESSLNVAVASTPKTPEQQALSVLKSNAKVQAASGDNSKIQDLVKSGQITQKQGDNLKQSSQQSSLAGQFSYLLKVDKAQAGKLIASASPADIAKLNQNDVKKAQDALVLSGGKSTGKTGGTTSSNITSLPSGKYSASIDGADKTFPTQQKAQNAIDFQNFKDSGKNYDVVNGTVFRKDAQGNASQMTKTAFDYQVGQAKLTQQKNSGDLQGYLSTAKGQLDSINKQLQDPSVDPLDALKLQNDAEALQKNINKYSSYGGFTKGKKGSKASTANFKTASKLAKIPAPKGIKVKQAKFKAPTTRKLSVSKIPSNYTTRKLG